MPRAILFLVAVASFGADWPSWRGPTRDGRAPDTGYPLVWTATENVKWKTPLAGSGHSSPIVVGDRVFVTGCVEKDRARVLYCLDRNSGEIRWERTVLTAPLEGKHALNSFASSTPACDGERVYVGFFDKPHARVYCYSVAGEKLWEKSPGEFHSKHGYCSSPLLHKDLVIVNCDQDAVACVVAFDKRTGEEKWRTDRPNRTRSYCPPVVFEAAGRTQMVMTGSKCVCGYDPDTGKQLWIVDGPTEQFVSSMVHAHGVFFLTAGFPEYWVMAIRPDGTGNVTKSHVAWSKKNEGGYVPSPVAAGDWFFTAADNGIATCWDAKTGTLKWKERIGRHFSGSAVAAEGRVYFVDDDGVTTVVKASDAFEVLAKNPLGEKCFTSPAFADGRIYFRGEKHLICIGK
jgi:outer membrane protein assembly factor BamB